MNLLLVILAQAEIWSFGLRPWFSSVRERRINRGRLKNIFQTAPPEQTVHAAPLPCSLPFPAPPSRANRAISVRFHAECPLWNRFPV